MSILHEMLDGVRNVVILGHMRPDGDCAGSCLGLYNYLSEHYPEISAEVFLEPLSEKFSYLTGFEQVKSVIPPKACREFDLCVTLDASDKGRLGAFLPYLERAKKSFCVDHHITNSGFATVNVIEPEASSTCEVLYTLLEPEKISEQTAECIYTGLVHDTGVFKFSCTSPKTMQIAGELMAKGIPFGWIIDESFYKKTYVQNQILGRTLLESVTFLHGFCIFSAVRMKDMQFYGVDSKDLDGIVEQLRLTDGVECAIFLYETNVREFKVSMRSKNIVDVSKVASYFGGGGHRFAAGCTLNGSIHDVINNLSGHIERQLIEAGALCITE